MVRAVTGYELPDGHGGLVLENVERQAPAVSEVVEVAEPEVPPVPEDEVGIPAVEVGDVVVNQTWRRLRWRLGPLRVFFRFPSSEMCVFVVV